MTDLWSWPGGRAAAARCNEALRESIKNDKVPVFTDLETEVLWLMSHEDCDWLEHDTEEASVSIWGGNFRGRLIVPNSVFERWKRLWLIRHDPELLITMDDATPEEEAAWRARWHNYVLSEAGRSFLDKKMESVAWVRRGDLHGE